LEQLADPRIVIHDQNLSPRAHGVRSAFCLRFGPSTRGREAGALPRGLVRLLLKACSATQALSG
jgi:hypothetical protein